MNLLPDHQIKQYQLTLLEYNGPSLSQFSSNHHQTCKISNNRKVFQKHKLNVMMSRSMGFSSNANIKGFINILLEIMYSSNANQDILAILKSTFYDSQINVTQIKHNPFPKLTNTQAKKLLVQFFYLLAYSSEKDKIQSIFKKYPIVIDILTASLRNILIRFNVKYASNFLFKIPTYQVIQILVQYFDLNCKLSKSLFLFYQENFFILQTQNNEILIGKYSQKQLQASRSFNNTNIWQNVSLSQCQSSFEINRQAQMKRQSTQSDIIKKQQALRIDNHKVELRNLICQNNSYEPQNQQDAPTPFFSSEIPFLNFKHQDFKKSKQITPLTSKRHSSFGNHINEFDPILQSQAKQNEIDKRCQIYLQKRSIYLKQAQENNFFNMLGSGIQKSQKHSLKRSRSDSSLQNKSKGHLQVELSNKGDIKTQKINRSQLEDNRSSIVVYRQKTYSEYNRSNNNSEVTLSQNKRVFQKISNLYSINIENIAYNGQNNTIINDLQRKKTQSTYIRSNIHLNANLMPQTPINQYQHANNQLPLKYYNPQQRPSNDKNELLAKQFQQRLKYNKTKQFMFKKDKIINNVNADHHLKVTNGDVAKLQYKGNYHFKQQKTTLSELQQCALSPISHQESELSNFGDKNNINKVQMLSFTAMNSLKVKQFTSNQRNALFNKKQ